jgi:hypothetical protein
MGFLEAILTAAYAGTKDMRRCNHIGDPNDPRYEYRYPLIELGWDRERCIDEIRREGWPVPHKSSCFFCPSIQPKEVLNLPADQLRRIILMEARAKPRLTKIEGLWRKTRKRDGRLGTITAYIRQQKLLPGEEIDRILPEVPEELIRYQQAYADGHLVSPFSQFIQIQMQASEGSNAA